MKTIALIFLLNLMLSFSLYADNNTDGGKNTLPLRETILALLAKQPQQHFHFVQEKKLAMLKKPLITEGELILQDDNVLIWDIQKPYTIRYELHRDFIKESDANGERSMSSGNNPLAAALTEAMIAAFSGHWENKENLASITATGAVANWKLAITPTSNELQKLIRSINVEGSNNTIHTISITESNSDSTVIHLTK